MARTDRITNASATARPMAIGGLRSDAARRSLAARAGRAASVVLGGAAGVAWLVSIAYILVQLVTWWVLLPSSVALPGSIWLR